MIDLLLRQKVFQFIWCDIKGPQHIGVISVTIRKTCSFKCIDNAILTMSLYYTKCQLVQTIERIHILLAQQPFAHIPLKFAYDGKFKVDGGWSISLDGCQHLHFTDLVDSLNHVLFMLLCGGVRKFSFGISQTYVVLAHNI